MNQGVKKIKNRRMKILLVGGYPPPFGGITI